MLRLRPFGLILALCVATVPMILPVAAQTEGVEREAPMTFVRMGEIMARLDPEAVVEPGGITLTVDAVPVTVVADPRANRMRILVPIASTDALEEADLLRLMQANFDTALDARYAIANGRLWSTFIHPLAELSTEQVISGVGQTVVLAQTFGETYSSGALIFGGGDTRGLIEELLDRGQEL